MSLTGEVLDAVSLVQQYNLRLYKYLTNGLVENSLTVSQLKVEFDDYIRFRMIFFTRMRDPEIPFMIKHREQVYVFKGDVERNDRLRHEIYKIQRCLLALDNMGQPIPTANRNMIVEDFPELCISTNQGIALTVLCDQIFHKYNIHNVNSTEGILRLAEEETVSMKVSNPVLFRLSQNKPTVPAVRPATLEVHPAESTTDTHDVTPVMQMESTIVEDTANMHANDIKLSNSMDEFIKELVQPVTTCNSVHSAQADIQKIDQETCDQDLSFLKDIPELNPEFCLVSTQPKCDTQIFAMLKNSINTVTRKKQDVTRDYKEYPAYTTRTDPVISWDELITKFQELYSTQQENASIPPKPPNPVALSQNEEVKLEGHSQSLDTGESSGCKSGDSAHQDSALTTVEEHCERMNSSSSNKMSLQTAAVAVSKGLLRPSFGVTENKIKRRQHTPKNPIENLNTAESLKCQQERAEQLAALELKRLKTKQILNEQYEKSWDGKVFAHRKAQSVSTVEKALTPTAAPASSNCQQSTKVVRQTNVNPQLAKPVSHQPAKPVNHQPAKAVNQQPPEVVSQQPAEVVSHQPAKAISQQPTKDVGQPTANQSRKRPAPSSVNTVLSASAAKRVRQYKHRIVLKLFREDSDWNVERIVDRY